MEKEKLLPLFEKEKKRENKKDKKEVNKRYCPICGRELIDSERICDICDIRYNFD